MDADLVCKELLVKFTRSGGKGGQHVNKVSTKVELYFHLENSQAFTPEEKERLRERLGKKISAEGFIKVTCEETRSQQKNKEIAEKKLVAMLGKALIKEKPRKPAKITAAMKRKRLEEKKKRSELKKNRDNPLL